MPQVTLNVNSTPYQLACNEGEQDRLRELAAAIDAKVAQLVGAVGQIGEAKLLLMAGIILLDEASESSGGVLSRGDFVSHLGDMDTLAAQIENIAARMESA